jgi:hypothetical protein
VKAGAFVELFVIVRAGATSAANYSEQDMRHISFYEQLLGKHSTFPIRAPYSVGELCASLSG